MLFLHFYTEYAKIAWSCMTWPHVEFLHAGLFFSGTNAGLFFLEPTYQKCVRKH